MQLASSSGCGLMGHAHNASTSSFALPRRHLVLHARQSQALGRAGACNTRALLEPHVRTSNLCCKAAAAAAGSAPAPDPGNVKPAKRKWSGMLPSKLSWDVAKADWKLLTTNLWAVLVIYALRDVLAFALHRGSQRITNIAAEALLGIPISSFANPWWLYLESNFLDANKGYQLIMGFFFLLALPLNFLINAAAAGSAALVCTRSTYILSADRPSTASSTSDAATSSSAAGALPTASAASAGAASASFAAAGRGACGQVAFRTSHADASTSTSQPAASAAERARAKGPLGGLRRGISDTQHALSAVRPMLRRLWKTDVVFNLQSMPLQALCLAVVPVYWALPRLLGIQLALPVAALEGKEGKAALERSQQLMEGFKGAYAWPFVALIAGSRLLDLAKQALLVAMPVRWWQEVIEVPIAATIAFSVARLLLSRLQDLLPLVVYLQRSRGGSRGSVGAN